MLSDTIQPNKDTKNVRRLILIGAPIFCFALLLGGYAWHRHEQVAETSARLQEILIGDQGLTELVMEKSRGMTYDEFFRACNRSIDERNKLVAAVRLLPINVMEPLRERVISHMKAMNELVRAKTNLMHHISRWRSINVPNEMARLEAEFFRTQLGGRREAVEWAYKRAVAKVGVQGKQMREAADAFDELYDELVAAEVSISVDAHQAGITFESCLKKFAKSNKALSASARKAAK